MNTGTRVAIVGGGHAGGRTALHLRACGFVGEILMVGEEKHTPYERPPLSKEFLFEDERAPHASLTDAAGWAAARVALRLGTRALRLDADSDRVELDDGTSVEFDHLIIATGASPRRLTLPGMEDPRVVYLRTIEDATRLRERLRASQRIAVLGAGVIGLEVAAAARRIGMDVVIIENGERVMARVVPAVVSDWIASLHAAQGVRFQFSAGLERIADDPRGGLRLSVHVPAGVVDIAADLLVVAIGVEPTTGWLKGSGLALSQGVVVDSFCRSAERPNCFAVGDVATAWHTPYAAPLRQETWRNAENQARAVAEIICGRTEPYVEFPWMWSDQYDANIQMLGVASHARSGILRGDPTGRGFSWIGMNEGVPVCAALVNAGRERRTLEKMIAAGQPVDEARLADRGSDLRRLVA